MYSEKDIIRLKSIQTKLKTINDIVKRHNGITKALSDIEGQPAILMLLIAIAEQFNKLQKEKSSILKPFNTQELKGLASTRNFIAHDYDGVNLAIIEDILRYKLPNTIKLVDIILDNQI